MVFALSSLRLIYWFIKTVFKKKLYLLFFALFTVFLFVAPFVGLAGDAFGDPPEIVENVLFGNLIIPTFIEFVFVRILKVLWQIFVGVAIVMFTVAAGLFLSAQGNPEDIKKAQKAFLWGVVGMIVGLLAFIIHNIVRGILGL